MLLALVLFLLPGAYREAIARGVRSTVLRPVLAVQQGSVERSARFADPDRLRAERDSLAAFLVGQATLESENRALRELLGLQRRLPPAFVPAEVVRIPGRATEGFFQLTVGREQGVTAGAPVVSSAGLVGRVREVDENAAFAIDWMHPDFRASAMTVDGDVYGIVEPRRGPGGEPMLALAGTASHIELEEGELVVTSGHGGVFPRGVPIGTVAGLEEGGTSWQRSYLVRPLVSPAEMAHVLVLTGRQDTLDGDDLAARWGVRPPEPAEIDTAAAPAAAPPAPARPAGEEEEQQQPRLLGVPAGPTGQTGQGDTGGD